MKFAKGHGTQNDFVVLPDPAAELSLTGSRVAALCDRRRGLGADGVLRVTTAGAAAAAGVLDRLPDGVAADDWYMDYRNADGSIAQMCGNGVRVFAHYLRASGLEDRDDFVVGSLAGPGRSACIASTGPPPTSASTWARPTRSARATPSWAGGGFPAWRSMWAIPTWPASTPT
ncbi:diaminopimelate epimerase family protein [Mycobacterium intracellulare 1956]|uniref:diaminopimelate epimerase n=1 Tax=Mycobacterium intracellulare 1956 TaxID=1299331 RepID=X8CJP3_MYCIT|nr:diaminopimelate epimerase family protein [Mycobacterium intracellulare 1956]